jgi:phenylacetate-CoA ligase
VVADGVVGLYHRAPYRLRVAVASARGAQLTRLRYGPETDGLVQAALDRDRWPVERLQAWQDERLATVLAHAHRAVPAHRARWAERRRAGRGGDPTVLADWPVLSKAAVRAAGATLRADTATGRLWEEHTSGSTGTPVHVWQTRAAVRGWYALIEARLRRWNGVDRNDRWAMVGGQLVVRPGSQSPPWWVWNAGQHQLYLSALDIAPRTAAAYADAIRDHRVRYLHGYPSAMHALATSIERAGAVAPQLAVALSNAEPLLDHQRAAIERVFGCPVRDTYGMTELVAGASECEAGSLHLWPEAGVVEIVDDDDRPCPPGTAGRVLCTGLLNDAMPLVRYEVGDRAALGAEPCACGRTLPVLAAIEGRLDDVVVGVDGRLVGRLDHVFKADVPIAEAQIVQHALGEFEIRVVPASGWDEGHGRALAGRLRDRVGDANVTITVVDALERGANGKLRAVISAVAADRTSPTGTVTADPEGGSR